MTLPSTYLQLRAAGLSELTAEVPIASSQGAGRAVESRGLCTMLIYGQGYKKDHFGSGMMDLESFFGVDGGRKSATSQLSSFMPVGEEMDANAHDISSLTWSVTRESCLF